VLQVLIIKEETEWYEGGTGSDGEIHKKPFGTFTVLLVKRLILPQRSPSKVTAHFTTPIDSLKYNINRLEKEVAALIDAIVTFPITRLHNSLTYDIFLYLSKYSS
jgi:hypothetical protein